MDGVHEFRSCGCRVALPAGAFGVSVPPPPECRSMAHLRGEIVPGAPMFGVVTTRDRERGSASQLAATLARSFLDPPQPVTARVPGSRRAARVDGRIDMEEGLSPDGIERIAIVVAELRDEFAVLTVRTRPCDDVADRVDALIDSFAVLQGG